MIEDRHKLLSEDNYLILRSEYISDFIKDVSNQIIHDIEFKLSNEDYPKDIVKAWQDDITKLSDDNVSYDTVMNYAKEWGYKTA